MIWIAIGAVIIAIVAIALAFVWVEVKDFKDFTASTRFIVCQPPGESPIPQKGGRCIAIKFDVEKSEITDFSM